jgi:hypothetical protein
MNKNKFFFRGAALLSLLCLSLCVLPAQEIPGGEADLSGDEGFGFDGGGFGFGASGASGISVNLGGELSSEILLYTRVLTGKEKFEEQQWGDLINGTLNLSVSSPVADGFIGLKLDGSDIDNPLEIDEAYFRVTVKAFDAELGLRKLSWGKADSMGPLDVINPLDYSELTDLTDLMGIKIARPMVHLSYRFGDFSKLEGVFIPWFRAYKLDLGTAGTPGRWTPSQLSELGSQLASLGLLVASGGTATINGQSVASFSYSDSENTLEYAQGGLRFTTTLGPADLGVQYYSGHFFQPSVSGTSSFLNAALQFGYNRFHQIGIDYAQVLFGFNIRAEAGANLTSDFSGDDGAVENPALVWSLGFDRDLVWGINLNLQGTGSVRLMHDKLRGDTLAQGLSSPLAPPGVMDAEAGKNPSATRITAQLSKKFFRDELEVKCTGLWNIEGKDFLILPAVVWTRGDLSLEASAGIFGGDSDGEFGQYADNTFIKAVVTWKF